MSVYVSKLVRSVVVERAGNRCEYCRIPQAITNNDFHIEHIIGLQHGGSTSPENLAWCCAFCNWKKGPNIATVIHSNGNIVPLFNPRKQLWFDHFEASDGVILAKTETGEATSKLLEFNLSERVYVRSILSIAGFFP